ncbi:SMI1/KNR4 family protein [Neobacillus drentensis]|uniref:SMI1/KNR4 family protein n=1 Tax=Neobacillus drentensis TaxID=220684 RepID=UPI002FFF0067
MKIELLQAIDEEFEMCAEAFGGPVEEEEISEAEDTLQIKLPQDYKMFLLKYGSGAVGEVIVLGLKEAEFVATPSFVEQSLKFRDNLPEGYEKFNVIGIDGAGNPIGFNLPNTEIIRFYIDLGEQEVIANSFEEYLEKALKEEINIHF